MRVVNAWLIDTTGRGRSTPLTILHEDVMPSHSWKVTKDGKLIDIVSYDASYETAEEVKRSLVNHDGYDSGIVVRRHRQKRYSRPYLGLNRSLREVFRSIDTPTGVSHPQYRAVVGPFRTKRAAEFVRDHGTNNPHLITVADAERVTKSR